MGYNGSLAFFNPCAVPVLPHPPALTRWQQLVTPAWLADLAAGRAVQAAPPGHWRLFEVGCGGAALFRSGHVKGAGYIDTNSIEQAPLWNKVADAALLQMLLENGIGHDSCVVLYGRNTLAAARVAHLMLYAGVKDVRLLDGGLAAWSAAGLPLLDGPADRHAALGHFGTPFPAHPEYLIDMAQARALLLQHDGTLVSIRSWTEFCGHTSGYDYIAARGDIAGARWGRAGMDGDCNSMSAFQNPDGCMKPAAELSRFWGEAGIHCGRQTAFYCGTGWRASLAFFYAWLMGWERISVYDGGWYEWSGDAANPTTSALDPTMSTSALHFMS